MCALVFFTVVNMHSNCIILYIVGGFSAPYGALSSSTDKMTFI